MSRCTAAIRRRVEMTKTIHEDLRHRCCEYGPGCDVGRQFVEVALEIYSICIFLLMSRCTAAIRRRVDMTRNTIHEDLQYHYCQYGLGCDVGRQSFEVTLNIYSICLFLLMSRCTVATRRRVEITRKTIHEDLQYRYCQYGPSCDVGCQFVEVMSRCTVAARRRV